VGYKKEAVSESDDSLFYVNLFLFACGLLMVNCFNDYDHCQ